MPEDNTNILLHNILEMRQDIGEMKANLSTFTATTATHEARITELEKIHQRQTGAVKMLNVIGTAFGVIFGSIVTYFAGWHVK